MSKQLSRRELLRLGVLGGVGGLAAAYLPTHKVMAQAQATKPTLSKTMATATVAFLDTLDANARAKATYAFSNEERFRWHWTTPAGFPRNGLPLREMNDNQQKLALALLQ